MREDDIKLTKWVGFYKDYTVQYLTDIGADVLSIKNYTTSDADAVTLLPKTREKFEITLESVIAPDAWSITLWRDGREFVTYQHPEICGAICGALLEVINERH